jgi:hypothetical protein
VKKTAILAATLLLSAGARLGAQTIGSLPDQSPYLDLNDGQRFGVVAGWLVTGKDPAGVGPKSSPIGGLRYDLAIGGPAYLYASLFGTSTSRTVLDYTKSATTRNIGTQGLELVNFSIGVAASLTGARTWRHWQPLVNLGVGLIAGPGDKPDVSNYQFQSALSVNYGFGLRYATGKNGEFRADLNQYLWQLHYPELYRSTQGSPTAIYPTGSLTRWTFNTSLTLGYSIRSFR